MCNGNHKKCMTKLVLPASCLLPPASCVGGRIYAIGEV
jgi:hypothetical protein